jgi:hypothetical protein
MGTTREKAFNPKKIHLHPTTLGLDTGCKATTFPIFEDKPLRMPVL